jgi:hypothetical protein
VTGKPILPPEKLREQLLKQQAGGMTIGATPPRTLVPQKTVRVQSALKPGMPGAPGAPGQPGMPGQPALPAGKSPGTPPKSPAPKR